MATSQHPRSLAPTPATRRRRRHDENPEPGTWSMEEACALLGIGTSTGYRLDAEGRFPVRVRRIGNKRKILKSEMARYLAGEDPDNKAVS